MVVEAGHVKDGSSNGERPFAQQTAEMHDWLANLKTWVESQRAATQSLIGTFRQGRPQEDALDDGD